MDQEARHNRVLIEGLGSAGDGLVRTPAGTRFVPGALPGETWNLVPGAAATRLDASPSRRTPSCPHFGACGGCAAQHMGDDLYVSWKRDIVETALSQQGLTCDVATLTRVPEHSRRRATLTLERKGGDVTVGFNAVGTHRVVRIETCLVLAPQIVAALPLLRNLGLVLLDDGARARATVLATSAGLDVAFTAERPQTLSESRSLKLTVIAGAAPRGQLARLSFNSALIASLAEPRIAIDGVSVSPPAGGFLQSVEDAQVEMIRLVVSGVGKARRIVDLYAGLGTFTLPLARKARMLAIDADEASIAALKPATRAPNGLKPIETRVRNLATDPLSARELGEFDAVVLDPPFAGANAQALAIGRSKVPRVVMVSCNPTTLARDLAVLVAAGFTLEVVTPVDQFLYAAHVEVVAVLGR